MATFGLAISKVPRRILPVGALVAVAVAAAAAHAQTAEPKSPAQARVIVVGEGSVTVAPDYARLSSGVSTTAKTVKEASDSNSKVMAAIIATLVDSGIAKKDIQTTQLSIEPIYTSPSSKFSADAPNGAPKLSGFHVSNQVNVTIHEIGQAGDILDRLVKAGATDVGNIVFLFSEQQKALDQAREAAVANARHKAELYAQASGVNLGRVAWITESSDFEPIAPMGVARGKLASPAQRVPIERGEDTITARVTVGFDLAQ
jgi:uncharacterized protein YggE